MNRLGICAVVVAAFGVSHVQGQSFGAKANITAVQYYGANLLDYRNLGGLGSRSVGGSASVPGALASGSGDLSSGLLRAAAAAEERRQGSGHSHGAGAVVEIWDRITLTAGTDVTALFVPMRFEIDGLLEGPMHARSATFEYWINGQQVTISPGESTLAAAQLQLPGAGQSRVYDLRFKLSVSAYGGIAGRAEADFSHTARIQWDLPAGVTYTSTSGVFNPGTIPAPGAAVLLGVGFAIASKRRRS